MWMSQDDYDTWLREQAEEQEYFRYQREVLPCFFQFVEDWEDSLMNNKN